MTRIPEDLLYTKDHEWIDTATGRIGITDHAQSALGDIVFCELPAVGKTVGRGDPVAVVESVKSVSDVYAPVAGQVRAVNEEIRKSPEKVNQDPYGGGWFLEIDAGGAFSREGLLSPSDYRALVGEDK